MGYDIKKNYKEKMITLKKHQNAYKLLLCTLLHLSFSTEITYTTLLGGTLQLSINIRILTI